MPEMAVMVAQQQGEQRIVLEMKGDGTAGADRISGERGGAGGGSIRNSWILFGASREGWVDAWIFADERAAD